MGGESISTYVEACSEFRAARGHVKLIRDMCQVLLTHLELDLEAPEIDFDAPGDDDEESLDSGDGREVEAEDDTELDSFPGKFYSALWPSISELSGAVLRLRRAREAAEAAWVLLSKDEQAVAVQVSNL